MFRLISHVQFDKKYVLTAKPIKVEDRKQELGFTFRVNMPNSSFQYTTTSNSPPPWHVNTTLNPINQKATDKTSTSYKTNAKAPFFPSQNT